MPKGKRTRGQTRQAYEASQGPSTDTYFRDGILAVRGYRFNRTVACGDPGAMDLVAEGVKLDGRNESRVVAKISEGAQPEKEAYVIRLLSATLEGGPRVLRVVEAIAIPPIDGNVKVIICRHPGGNVLSQYMSYVERTRSLLPGTEEDRARACHEQEPQQTRPHAKMPDAPPATPSARTPEEATGRSIDLSSFLHFALQAVQCLEVLHASYGAHGDVRPSTFHWSDSDDLVRFAHIGGQAIHLENYGSTASLILDTQQLPADEQEAVHEILCYLPPEYIGDVAGGPNHLSDLYGLGATFWRLLSGRRMFAGSLQVLLTAITMREPPSLHYVRPDIPTVISKIVQKLLSKDPEERYSSASGLKEDLIECNRNLGQGWTSEDGAVELIKDFPLGRSDRHSVFHIYGELFGREQETKVIQRCIRDFAAQYKRRTLTTSSQYGSGTGSCMSTDSFDAAVSSAASTASNSTTFNVLYPSKRDLGGEGGLRMLVVKGAAGSGKSSVLLRECHREIPATALVGQAKFDPGLHTPYSAILQCLASVFRQLLTFTNAEIFAFGNALHERLGPQISNTSLLFAAVPEFEKLVKTVWTDAFVSNSASSSLGTTESRIRFENLLTDIITELASTKMVAFFLDDLHNADASSLSMIEAFGRARVNILILATVRTSNPTALERLSGSLGSRLTLVPLRPLTSNAISGLVCRTLHITQDEAAPLVNCLARHSHGNPFSVRSLLFLLKSENYLVFNFNSNQWTFSPSAALHFLDNRSKINPDDVEANFLLQHLRDLSIGTQQLLAIAAVIGPVFDSRLVFTFMEDADMSLSGTDDSDDTGDETARVGKRSSNAWVSGLQNAIMENMIVTRGKDSYAFTHDRYREASLDLAKLHFGGLVHISAKLVDIMLEENEKRDDFKISDQILRGLEVLRQKPSKSSYVKVLVGAGTQALAQGAPESAFLYYEAIYRLMGANAETSVVLQLSELLTWKGEVDRSDALLANVRQLTPEGKVNMLQTRSRNLHHRQQLAEAQELLFDGLRELGISLKSEYSDEEVDERHRTIRKKLLDFGLDNIRNLPPATDEICNLRNVLLAEVWIFAYFRDQKVARMIAYEGISLALKHGLSAHNGMAFICFASAAVTQRDFVFATQVGRLALELSLRLSTPVDKGRVHLYFVSLIASSDSEHFMQTWALSMQGYKLARAGGDALFAAFGQCHMVSNKFYTFQTLGDAIEFSRATISDLSSLPQDSSPVFLTLPMGRTLKAIAGLTSAHTPDDIFDSDDWDHQAYLASVETEGATWDSIYNWHESYRNAALYNLGFHQVCFEVGRFTSATAHLHPGHRHNQLSQFYVGLAACHLAREDPANEEYISTAKTNLAALGVCLEPSRINIAHWYHLLAAEISSCEGGSDTILLYDKAIDAAERGQWALEGAWALYLAGLHFDRLGASTMSASFQKQAFNRFSAIGANGVIRRLVGVEDGAQPVSLGLTASGDYCDVDIQTDPTAPSVDYEPLRGGRNGLNEPSAHTGTEEVDVRTSEESLERVIQHLSSKDLASLIFALQAITTDVNLSSSLERLTNLMMSTTSASVQLACIVARHEESGNFHLFTTQRLGESVNILSPTVALEDTTQIPDDGVVVSIIQHVLHSGKPLCLGHVANDPRFKHEAEGAAADINSVLVLPIRSKGITTGALYLASYRESAFSEGDILVLNLLAMQAAVLVSNGFLFASLRRSTQANLRAISEQRIALEAARKSQEEALHATRVKSIFLANMSHEMRTPFAAFYGVLGLLSETDLTNEQRELVGTAKQSCELLLETISALLDFSKLEAHAVKLSLAPLSLTDLLVDCEELLTTLASDKELDLTYNVDPSVPVVEGDSARLRQILQNLIGNALKFTLKGSVDAAISVDRSNQLAIDSSDICVIQLKITDTGIGLSKTDIARLFLPFSQIDSSSTRTFGGTGLGLSICRELINLMGGKISVSSQVGTGSSFTCLIPLRICSNIPPSILAADGEVKELQRTLTTTPKTTLYAYSPSSSTRAGLRNYLNGLDIHVHESLDQLKNGLTSLIAASSDHAETLVIYPTAVIVDGPQSTVNQVLIIMDDIPPLRRTRIVQLLPRSLTTMHRPASANPGPSDPQSSRISRCSKPLRAASLLRLLVELHSPPVAGELNLQIPTTTSSSSDTTPTPRASPAPAFTPTSATPKIASNFTAAQLASFKSTRILIAEDNLVAQRLLSRQLQNLGFIVTAASNGVEAVDHWKGRPTGYFTVALFDHHMPLCDGLNATRQIRSLEKERQVEGAIPIVSLTADAHTQAMEDCLNAGMQMYLTKPLRQDDLIKLIRTFVLAEIPV